MPQIAQHQAAELWEVCRDHLVGASTIRMMAQGVRDPQLRSMLERHAQDFDRAAQRLQQFLHEPGAGSQAPAYGDYTASGYGQPGAQSWTGQPAGQNAWSGPNAGYGAPGMNPYDVTAAAACLDKCKSMAVKCTIGATEASQPARSYLHQLAGEHLRMAEEHYHWLERHGAYASPKADYSAINDYSQKLRQFAQAGQQLAQQIATGYIPQAVAHGGPTAVGVAPEQIHTGWNVSPSGIPYTTASGPHHTAGVHQPTWSSHDIEPRGYSSAHSHQYRGESR